MYNPNTPERPTGNQVRLETLSIAYTITVDYRRRLAQPQPEEEEKDPFGDRMLDPEDVIPFSAPTGPVPMNNLTENVKASTRI